jgi:hypothetical protein
MPLRLLGRAARRKELFDSDARVASVVSEAVSLAIRLDQEVTGLRTWIDRKAQEHG